MSSSSTHLRAVVNQDGAAILDVTRNQITTLNSTGGLIWDMLRHGRTVEEAIQDLAAETNADPAVVEPGVREFVEQLKSEHLLSSQLDRTEIERAGR
jgi:6-phosphogluconate dehydrogenase (decarboxylating)